MANQFLDKEGLIKVSDYVNQKLKIVSLMPTDAEVDDMVAYNGVLTEKYKPGNVYIYALLATYYGWTYTDTVTGTKTTYYTESPTPKVGDTVYVDNEGKIPFTSTINVYDAVNNTITLEDIADIYTRDEDLDNPIYDWINRSGSTSIILNGEDKSGTEANFYAPGEPEKSGEIVVSNGPNQVPTWSPYAGYCPVVVEDNLVFFSGILPDVEDTSMIFDIG